MSNDIIKSLELQFNSALNCKFMREQQENQQRIAEHNLTNEIRLLKKEIDILNKRLETINKDIAEKKTQIAKTEVCKVYEQIKSEYQRNKLIEHVNSFKSYFSEGESKVKEAKIEQQSKELLINKMKEKTLAIQEECNSIELECEVFKKRNKAIMLQLKRKLHEARTIIRRHNDMEKNDS